MTRQAVIVVLLLLLLFASNKCRGADKAKTTGLATVKVHTSFEKVADRKVLVRLVEYLSKHDRSLRELKASFVGFAYSGPVTCQGKSIFILSDQELKLPSNFIPKDGDGFPLIGSAGGMVRVFLAKSDGRNPKQVFSENLIDFFGFGSGKICPDIRVEIHGNQFDRPGNSYGFGILRFRNGRYEIHRRNKDAVEFDLEGKEIFPPRKDMKWLRQFK